MLRAKPDAKKVPADAKIPASGGGAGSRSKATGGPSKEELDAILREARRTGNKAGILKAIYERAGVKLHPDIERLKNQG